MNLTMTRWWRRTVTVFATMALCAGGMALASPASAAPDVETTVTVTNADADGLSLDVSGSGYTDLPDSTGGPAMGIYVALRDPATMSNDDINEDTNLPPAVEYVPSMDKGEFTTTLEAPADELERDADYEVITWVAHGEINDDTLLDKTAVELTDADKDALFGPQDEPDDDTDGPGDDDRSSDRSRDNNNAGNGGSNRSSDSGTSGGDAGVKSKNTDSESTAGGAAGASDKTGDTSTPNEPQKSPQKQTQKCTPATSATKSSAAKSTSDSAQLDWGVKSSFVSYVEGGIAEGKVSAAHGAKYSGDSFTWGAGSGKLDSSGQGTLTFPGSVHFTGHDGTLDMTISNLQVKITGSGSGTLIADVKSQDMDGNDTSGTGIEFAELDFSDSSKSGGTASASLTAAGGKAFAGFYDVGQAMDELTVTAAGAKAQSPSKSGGSGGGDSSDDNCAGQNLPNTGASESSTLGLGLGGGLTALGALVLLIAAARRKSLTAV